MRFGTDGVRGVANLDLTPELVVALGRAAARVLAVDRFVVGRDTRISGPSLEAALTAGLTAEGITVNSMGVVPTPAVAWAAAQSGAAGAMISASHNRYPDNGIKLFTPAGRKLDDDIERALESALDALVQGHHEQDSSPTGDAIGTVEPAPEHLLAYAEAVERSIEGRDLSGLSIVVDCANGSATTIAPYVLRRLGAERRRPPRRAQRHQHQRGLRLDPPCRPAAGPWSSAAPTPASRSTATPIVCSQSTAPASSSTATRSSRSTRSICTSAAGCATTPSS